MTDSPNNDVLDAPAPKRRWRSRSWRVVRSILLIYLGLVIVFYALQTWMIFPGAATQGQPSARMRPMLGSEILSLQAASGEEVGAAFGPALLADGKPHPDASTRPTILFFYGNGMCMADCLSLFIDLRRLGFNVMIADYLGYGMSGGKPSEAGVYAAAEAAWQHLQSRDDIDRSKIVPVGWSLGAGAALEIATTHDVPAVAIMSAFTSTADMGKRLLPFLPTSLMVKHRFENERKIRQIKVPTFIAHGRDDEIVPHDMSDRLTAAAGGPVTRFHAESRHNDLFDLGGDELMNSLKEFVELATEPGTEAPPPVL